MKTELYVVKRAFNFKGKKVSKDDVLQMTEQEAQHRVITGYLAKGNPDTETKKAIENSTAPKKAKGKAQEEEK